MKAPRLRSIVVLASTALVSSLALAAPAPATTGAGGFHLAFLAGPADALVGETITTVPFVPTGGKVQVELLNSSNQRITSVPVTVTLSLQLDAVPSTLPLTANPVTTQDGVATFDVLSVGAPVRRLAGRPDGAVEAAREALALFEAKGNTVAAAIARATLGELESLGVS